MSRIVIFMLTRVICDFPTSSTQMVLKSNMNFPINCAHIIAILRSQRHVRLLLLVQRQLINCVKLTTHLHLVPRSRMAGLIPHGVVLHPLSTRATLIFTGKFIAKV
jgi:hypothetical protein